MLTMPLISWCVALPTKSPRNIFCAEVIEHLLFIGITGYQHRLFHKRLGKAHSKDALRLACKGWCIQYVSLINKAWVILCHRLKCGTLPCSAAADEALEIGPV